MPSNCGANNTEVAASAAKKTKTSAARILNLFSFQASFYLRGVCFDPKLGEFIAWFFPYEESAGSALDVHLNIFCALQEIQYTEDKNLVTIKISEGSLAVSPTGDSWQRRGEDLTGSVCFAVKINQKRFPKWPQYRNGTLVFRLQDGREHRFPCAY